jgi:hypothetical protein
VLTCAGAEGRGASLPRIHQQTLTDADVTYAAAELRTHTELQGEARHFLVWFAAEEDMPDEVTNT